MLVSVIIPARNAAATVLEALESLRAQTYRSWEAIVIDDGSEDATLELARTAADSRISVLETETGAGAGAARNRGIARARGECLLFLDADDWLDPEHLQLMVKGLMAEPSAGAAHCAWARVRSDGSRSAPRHAPDKRDLFDLLACRPLFAIHACLVKTEHVRAAGGFDEALTTCQDWDLWQRVARAGLRFTFVAGLVARYRVRPGSNSADPDLLVTNGLRVIECGHSSDPRVAAPEMSHAAGAPEDGFAAACYDLTAWAAGLALGAGKHPRALVRHLSDRRFAGLDASRIAAAIFDGATVLADEGGRSWPNRWPDRDQQITDVLVKLEERSGTPLLATRARTILERLVARLSVVPQRIGAIQTIEVDLEKPLRDLPVEGSVRSVLCSLTYDGMLLGRLELPVVDGQVSAYVLQDAAAARFAWPILGRFFAKTLYPNLRRAPTKDGFDVYRTEVLVGCVGRHDDDTALHDRVGWTVFLQELWGRPAWPGNRFYADASSADDSDKLEQCSHPPTPQSAAVVEVAEEIHPEELPGGGPLIVSVGGVEIGVIQMPRDSERTEDSVRTAITEGSGFELCIAAVREGILGAHVSDTPLRERLDRSARRRSAHTPTPLLAGPRLFLARRSPEVQSAARARRAVLPAVLAPELAAWASSLGEDYVETTIADETALSACYAPELVLTRKSRPEERHVSAHTVSSNAGRAYDRKYFESLFAQGEDPWSYTTPYERAKYEQALSLLQGRDFHRALEVGCAEGHFSQLLAPRVGTLIAADIADIALARAAANCRDHTNIEYLRFDMSRDDIPTGVDLIVCSEILYYMGSWENLVSVAKRLARALDPGGRLLMTHANCVVDEPTEPGFTWDVPYGAKTIARAFGSIRSLRLEAEIRTPLYRVQLYRRTRRGLPSRRRPHIVELEEQPAPLKAGAAEFVHWGGERAGLDPSEPSVLTTDHLPILMYHQIATAGSRSLLRYRVTPDEFDRHLSYLSEVGYQTVSLSSWQHALEHRQPIAGRAVVLTFDDATSDFTKNAWPLLKRYGYSAMLFVPTKYVGGVNAWDSAYSDQVDVLSWRQLRELAAEGVAIGSHSVTHSFMTALPAKDVVREGICSRVALARELGEAVDAFAYPYGDADPVVEHLIGACGYRFGLSVDAVRCSREHSLLALPRIEIRGDRPFEDFVAALELGE